MKTGLAAWFGGLSMWPGAVLACPMCFTGNNSNQDAFLWGSLFLMAVPVTAIGGLVYWAYRRIKAAEAESVLPRSPHPEGGSSEDASGPSRTALRLVRR